MNGRKLFGKEPVQIVRLEPLVAHCKLLTATEIVHKGPCLLVGLVITGDGGVADCDVYDGESAASERKFHLEALQATSFCTNLFQSTDMDYGIYVVLNTAHTIVTVQYIPERMDRFI